MDKRIKNLILDIRSNKRIGTFDEATTKQTIILRVLNELGWQIFDAEEVKPEHSLAGRRVDYSLRINSSNKVFLEVKKVKEDLEGHQKQLLDYSFQEGVRLAVLYIATYFIAHNLRRESLPLDHSANWVSTIS